MSTVHRRPRGFTLIELMIGVGIVGLLSSVAVPQYYRATLRSRAAERATIMDALSRAVNDVVLQQQAVPMGGDWNGLPNPPQPPGASKHRFDWAIQGWSWLPMVVHGDSYYRYSFRALDVGGTGRNVTLSVTGEGDLDGDGNPSVRTITFTGVGYGFKQDPEPFLDDAVF